MSSENKTEIDKRKSVDEIKFEKFECSSPVHRSLKTRLYGLLSLSKMWIGLTPRYQSLIVNKDVICDECKERIK